MSAFRHPFLPGPLYAVEIPGASGVRVFDLRPVDSREIERIKAEVLAQLKSDWQPLLDGVLAESWEPTEFSNLPVESAAEAAGFPQPRWPGWPAPWTPGAPDFTASSGS